MTATSQLRPSTGTVWSAGTPMVEQVRLQNRELQNRFLREEPVPGGSLREFGSAASEDCRISYSPNDPESCDVDSAPKRQSLRHHQASRKRAPSAGRRRPRHAGGRPRSEPGDHRLSWVQARMPDHLWVKPMPDAALRYDAQALQQRPDKYQHGLARVEKSVVQKVRADHEVRRLKFPEASLQRTFHSSGRARQRSTSNRRLRSRRTLAALRALWVRRRRPGRIRLNPQTEVFHRI